MSNNNSVLTKSIKEYLPIIYLFLIFLGYQTNGIYYSEFGINILDYYSLQEFLMAFIPLGTFLTTKLLFTVIGIIPILIFKKIRVNNSLPVDEDMLNIKYIIDKIRNTKTKGRILKIYEVGVKIYDFVLYTTPLVIFPFLIGSVKYHEILYQYGFIKSILIAWMFMLLFKFSLRENSIEKYKFKYIIGLTVTIITLTILLSTTDYIEKAENILNGKPKFEVSIRNGDKNISTSNHFLFIGKTDRYIFFRDIKTNENYIYELKNVSELKFKEIDN